ncbi:COMM domain-containing protein 10-like [Uranotaenia lowii]|uniref:COMM domain-containing protein 10-like n=1 Tax=Uranotaenia lowii TaxID=190385 RepID=UPI00247AA503|nr:COMM domain-containing protein 10-like [Uranotaenia lowii]XP_055610287.1 COMM domain-containing protein 10-like [Uranotaenia lowii]
MEHPIWFTSTDGLTNGINLCNQSLSDECFVSIIEYLFTTIDSPKDITNNDCIADVQQLQLASGFDEPQFQVVLKTLGYLVKRSLKFMLKPSTLQTDLRQRLQLNEAKANAFVKCWIQATKIILDSLESDQQSAENPGGTSNQLEDVSWKVRAQLSSEPRQKDKLALGQLELRTTKNVINLELNCDEIVELYNQLERIQVELDAVASRG